MEILEFGNPQNRSILLIHGFESPWQIWKPCIEAFRESYHVLVPILPGHNPDIPEEFESFERCAEELEDYYEEVCGQELYAVCGMSMGGVLAAVLWQRGNLRIRKLIFSSSPLECFGGGTAKLMTQQYLYLTHAVQQGSRKVLSRAVGTMVTGSQLEHLRRILVTISDASIRRYLQQIAVFRFRRTAQDATTQVYYYYGGKLAEAPFRKAAKTIQRVFPSSLVVCRPGCGHCEEILFAPSLWIEEMKRILE